MKKGTINRKEQDAEVQQEILGYLINDKLSVEQIAKRRGTTIWAVYNIIKKLKKKGLYSKRTNRGVQNKKGVQKTRPTKKQQIRLHGLELNIKHLWKHPDYDKKIGKIIDFHGNTARLNTNSIDLFIKEDFYADTAYKATVRAIERINRLLVLLENDLNLILVKPRSQNVTVVANHYAETNNELSEEYDREKKKIKIYGKEDGKLWFIIDNSLNLHEAETLHPKTAIDDIEKVTDVFNDIRDSEPVTFSKIKQVLKEISEQNRETAEGLNTVAEYLKTQIPKREVEDEKPKEKPDYFG